MQRSIVTRSLLLVLSLVLLLSLSCPAFAESGAANDDVLFDKYVESLFYGDTLTARKAPTLGSRLTGCDRMAYDLLVPEIKKIAAGERASTEFEIPYEDYLDSTTFTAEDLGVSSIIDGSNISAEAVEKINKLISDFNLNKITTALLGDLPYEMYWYNKADANAADINYRTQYSSEDGISLTVIGSCEFGFKVADAYQDGSAYKVKNACARTAVQAAANARQIVADNAALADRAKLQAYKEAICDLVEYNTAAATSSSTPYGNPWQLVYVFDNDTSTKVVCEGYSKAFKYLCDCSTFSGDVSVILVTGNIGEGHMWNIVNMNGDNCLVDVTNCDTDTAGYPDLLFMAKPVSGSVDEGYVFATRNDGTLTYVYDAGTKNSYTENELSYEQSDPENPENPPVLEDVFVLPPNTETVKAYAFDGVTTLTQVDFPASCASIGFHAFANCPDLTTIIVRNPDCSINQYAFEDTTITYIYTVPGSAVANYAEDVLDLIVYPLP